MNHIYKFIDLIYQIQQPMYTIENAKLRVSVHIKGAELLSVFDKVNNIEHLWQADPAFWPWHAPVLFPIVGRCLADTITIDGKEYPMEKHGFARYADFELIAQSPDALTFKLASSANTLEIYPYPFEFYISYELKGNTLYQYFEVQNKGKEPLPFSLGGHPAFAVPFLPGEKYEDYYIEFENDTKLNREHIDGDGFFDGRVSKVLDGNNKLPLTGDIFADDALIFKDLQSRKVTIKTAKNPHTLSVSFHHFYYLGLWAKVNAPYVCIEPWYGCADTAGKPTTFDKKEGIVSLPSLGKFDASIVITVS
ncbi:MAG: aldose 1-epimerase family protein [Bacteroidetes bacterium]|nr:aldose 1-epimerase family protein [Bacteroidota bacterium]